ncbi:MAG: hypothetical protein OIF54_10915 [Cohaesibacter sp.]|nr:hypothetical protein [Cohaesibacter sp.]
MFGADRRVPTDLDELTRLIEWDAGCPYGEYLLVNQGRAGLASSLSFQGSAFEALV